MLDVLVLSSRPTEQRSQSAMMGLITDVGSKPVMKQNDITFGEIGNECLSFRVKSVYKAPKKLRAMRKPRKQRMREEAHAVIWAYALA